MTGKKPSAEAVGRPEFVEKCRSSHETRLGMFANLFLADVVGTVVFDHTFLGPSNVLQHLPRVRPPSEFTASASA